MVHYRHFFCARIFAKKKLRYLVELLGNYIKGIKEGLRTPNFQKIQKHFLLKLNMFVILEC